MDPIVDSLSAAYNEFITAAAIVLESKISNNNTSNSASASALETFKHRWELFKVACDQAEEFVESLKQRIGSECLVDEATRSATNQNSNGQAGIPPISAVRLEQMSKAVRMLVIELQQHGSGSGAGSNVNPHTEEPVQ